MAKKKTNKKRTTIIVITIILLLIFITSLYAYAIPTTKDRDDYINNFYEGIENLISPLMTIMTPVDPTLDPYYRSAQLACWCYGDNELINYTKLEDSSQGTISCSDNRTWTGGFGKVLRDGANPPYIFASSPTNIGGGIGFHYFNIGIVTDTVSVSCGIGRPPYTNSGRVNVSLVDGKSVYELYDLVNQ